MEDKIFIEIISNKVKLDENTMPTLGIEGRKTYTTGLAPSTAMQMIELDDELLKKIRSRIQKFGEDFSDTIIADETELEFSFGITASGNICILSSGTQLGIKVTLKWKKQ